MPFRRFLTLPTMPYYWRRCCCGFFYAIIELWVLFLWIIGPIPWGHSGPLCHALSLSSLAVVVDIDDAGGARQYRQRHLLNGRAAARSGEWARNFSNASCSINLHLLVALRIVLYCITDDTVTPFAWCDVSCSKFRCDNVQRCVEQASLPEQCVDRWQRILFRQFG